MQELKTVISTMPTRILKNTKEGGIGYLDIRNGKVVILIFNNEELEKAVGIAKDLGNKAINHTAKHFPMFMMMKGSSASINDICPEESLGISQISLLEFEGMIPGRRTHA